MACKVNQIFLGEVSGVKNYGAFVKIPGCAQQGMIHKSQVSSSQVDDACEVLNRGDRVWCKIITIGEDDGKIALSMKYVNQGNGRDLDPNGVQLQVDEQKKKKMNYRDDRKTIVLEAVYKTTCTKCKTPGHLAKDCFTTPDGKKYELLPEIEDEMPVSQTSVEQDIKPKEKKHKSKKSKKRKKHKEAKEDNSDSGGSDCSVEKKKKKKKSSKEKHKKKKRHHSSSDDSDSSDSSALEHENKKHSKKCKYSKHKD